MARLVFTDHARESLQAIYRYISRRSHDRAVASNFVARLRQQCRRLADLPGIAGQACPEYHPGLRREPCGNYVILFRYDAGDLIVTNVIERHRDIQGRFDNGEE